jgi:hypothetical protein
MKYVFVAAIGAISLTLATNVAASTASQREYKRGYVDCAAGRWDENQHGASYKKGCRAAEDKRGSAPAAEAPETPAQRGNAIMDPNVSAKDKQACIRAVKKETQNSTAVVISAESSEANNQVTVGIGPQRAPWKCLVKRGKVSEVMSMTNEGAM